MPDVVTPVTSSLSKLSFTAVIDILVVAFIIYNVILVVRGTRAAHVLAGIGILLLVYVVSMWTHLELVRSMLANVIPYTAIALLVLFQTEIRRALAGIGRRRWLGFGGRLQRRESFDEILWALGRLSEGKIGALIVLERDMGLRTFIESGQMLDATLSRDLLLTIFQRGGPMHDGAVIVQGDRVAAAACFLPLTMNPLVARKLGTRHRAAIGITEDSDALSVVVSEETGRISVATFGQHDPDLSLQRVEERMARHFGYEKRRLSGRTRATPPAPAPVERIEDRRAEGA